MDFDSKLEALGLRLPDAPKPVGLYHPFVVSGKLAFLSGQISRDADGKILAGKVGKELTLEEGQVAARLAALNALSIMKYLIGIEKISRVVKMTGFVQSAPDFYEIPAVVNGASELIAQMMGPAGEHARSAVGMSSLPLNAAVEIELGLELK